MAPIHSCGEAGDRGSAMSGRKALRVSTPIKRLVASPLLRHLAAVQIGELGARGTRLNNASLALLVQHAPCLTSLQCWLKLTPTVPLVLPPRLTLLELRLEDNYTDAAINGVLTVLATLPSLSQLLLRLRAFQRETRTEVSLLAASRSLTELTLDAWYGNPQLTSTQLEQIRSSLGHLQRINVGWLGSYDLARLLQPPVTARWQDIGNVIGDELTGELLISLQSLTNLELTWEADFYDAEIVRVDFLPQLPRLTSLNLYSADCGEWVIPAATLLSSLVLCTSPRLCSLDCAVRQAHNQEADSPCRTDRHAALLRGGSHHAVARGVDH